MCHSQTKKKEHTYSTVVASAVWVKMRLVVQRVTSSSVSTEAGGVIGTISKGLCVLIGIKESDGPNEVEWFVQFPL
jgi:hypothetical protein